jgi:hypothetical protein
MPFKPVGHRVALRVKPFCAALAVIPPLGMEAVDVLAIVDVMPPLQGTQRFGIGRAREPLASEAELTNIARAAVGTRDEK